MTKTKSVILFTIKEDTSEIMSLMDTMGYEVVKVFHQKRRHPDPRYFLGKGRFQEVKEFLGIEDSSDYEEKGWRGKKGVGKKEKKKNEIDAVVVDSALKPSQHYRIENSLQIECIDRISLILSIFDEHAHTTEAKLQVELARLQYELPFLKEWVHTAKEGEKPGFMGGGAYDVDVYYILARRRIKHIKDLFKDIEKDRELKREMRKKGDNTIIAIAGYTNAGKSTLMKLLTGDDDIYVDDKLFATLSPVTRKGRDRKYSLLFTDTVGFIDDLPTETVEAFMSTLEEVFTADIVLLVVDVSDPDTEILRKIRASLNILMPEIGMERIIYVMNKMDLLSGKERERKIDFITREVGHDALFISASDPASREKIIRTIHHRGKEGRMRVVIHLSPESDESYRIIKKLKEISILSSIDFNKELMVIHAFVLNDRIEHLRRIVKGAGGSVMIMGERKTEVPPYHG